MVFSLWFIPPSRRELPAVSLRGVISNDDALPYELTEMNHDYEDIHRLRQNTIGSDYEISFGEFYGFTNRMAVQAEKQAKPFSPLPPPSSHSSQVTETAENDPKTNKCIAYGTTTHNSSTYPSSANPLYDNYLYDN